MNHRLSLLALGLLLSVGLAQAAETKTKQQSKMTECNAEAKTKDMKGDERKAFMKTCLSNKPVTQQDKMKTCNADAKTKDLKGDERKKFMSSCLKKDA